MSAQSRQCGGVSRASRRDQRRKGVIGMLTPVVRETVRNGNRIMPSEFRADPRGGTSEMTSALALGRIDVSAR